VASFTLIDHAWDDTPGAAIDAGQIPEPSSLGLLATGAAGVLATRLTRRRKEEEEEAVAG